MTTLRSEREALQARVDDLNAHREKLQSELDGLTAEYEKNVYALSVLERIDDGTGGAPRANRGSRRGETMSYALLGLRHLDRASDAGEIMAKMRELGWSAEPKNPLETVRTTLLRAVDDDTVRRTGHGQYELVETELTGMIERLASSVSASIAGVASDERT